MNTLLAARHWNASIAIPVSAPLSSLFALNDPHRLGLQNSDMPKSCSPGESMTIQTQAILY